MSRYSETPDGPVNPLHDRYQPPFTCLGCGRETRHYSSAGWHAQRCDRCLPVNENPELQRLLRMQSFNRAVNS